MPLLIGRAIEFGTVLCDRLEFFSIRFSKVPLMAGPLCRSGHTILAITYVRCLYEDKLVIHPTNRFKISINDIRLCMRSTIDLIVDHFHFAIYTTMNHFFDYN